MYRNLNSSGMHAKTSDKSSQPNIFHFWLLLNSLQLAPEHSAKANLLFVEKHEASEEVDLVFVESKLKYH
jgi:hypothetical protein